MIGLQEKFPRLGLQLAPTRFVSSQHSFMRAHPSRRQILDNALASSSRRDLVMRITEAPSGIAARFDFVLNIR